jgi:hypothetical protein
MAQRDVGFFFWPMGLSRLKVDTFRAGVLGVIVPSGSPEGKAVIAEHILFEKIAFCISLCCLEPTQLRSLKEAGPVFVAKCLLYCRPNREFQWKSYGLSHCLPVSGFLP